MESDEAGKLYDDYVVGELATEAARKQAIETRSFSIISANLALPTLFFAFRVQFNLAGKLAHGGLHGASVLALVASGAATVLAVVAAIPWNYPAPTSADIAELGESLQADPDDVVAQIREARLAQLAKAADTNGWKSVVLFLAFLATGISALSLAGVLLKATALV